MTEEIKAFFLVRPHISFDTCRKICVGNSAECFQTLAQSFCLWRINESLQPGFVKMRDLFHSNFLSDWRKAIDSHIRHCFLCRLDRGRIQLHPARVRKTYKAACSGL